MVERAAAAVIGRPGNVSSPVRSAHRAVRVEAAAAADLWDRMLPLAKAEAGWTTAERMIASSRRALAYLPEEVVSAVLAFRARAEPAEVLLLKGLIPPDVDPGPTPSSAQANAERPEVAAAAMTLVAVALLMGEPFGYESFYGGRVLQHVLPVRGMEKTQTGESSAGMLDWHVEDGFTPRRCHYFGLLCLRGHDSAATLVASAAGLDMPPDVVRILREPRFVLLPDSAHGDVALDPRPIPVLEGPSDAPEIAFDAHYLRTSSPSDEEARDALARVRVALDAAAQSFTLTAGDLMLLDNRRAVHARSPFTATNDGADRWLLRTMIWSSLPEFQRWRGRIVDLADDGDGEPPCAET